MERLRREESLSRNARTILRSRDDDAGIGQRHGDQGLKDCDAKAQGHG